MTLFLKFLIPSLEIMNLYIIWNTKIIISIYFEYFDAKTNLYNKTQSLSVSVMDGKVREP